MRRIPSKNLHNNMHAIEKEPVQERKQPSCVFSAICGQRNGSNWNVKGEIVIFLGLILDIVRIEVSFSNKLRHYSSNFDKVPKDAILCFSNLFRSV